MLEERQRELASQLQLEYLAQLARGARGAVFKARRARHDVVAVKCLEAGSEAALRRARREHALAAWAAGAGLGPMVLAASAEAPPAFMVMSCAACDLRRALAEARTPAETRALWAAAFALAADERLARRRLVCSDLKPANLLLFREADGGQLRLNDFDPAFWGRAEGAREAAAFNVLALASNSLFVGDARVADLPDAAAAVARRAGGAALRQALARLDALCRRGLYHYAGVQNAAAFGPKLLELLGDAGECDRRGLRELLDALRRRPEGSARSCSDG